MKQKFEFDSGRKRITLIACTLCAMSGLMLWSPVWRSRAQQQDRQLVLEDDSQSSIGKRVALVIGNGAYATAPVLKNPPNDARDMADALSKLGFKVEHGVDLNQKQMKFMIRQFGQKLRAGGHGVFYYAGHGVQSKGRNYLIPVDAVIESEADVEDAGVDLQLMLNYMDDAQNSLNIVILDACRNNPFARSFRSVENGLAQVDAPTGTLIAYATAPGRVASDGPGQNGLYTSELLKQMRVHGVNVMEMFMRVRAEVVKQTGGKQVPWEASSLIGTFSFNTATNSASSATSKPRVKLENAEAAVEGEYWESIKNSTNAADYKEYLKEYPQGRYAQLARLRLRQWETTKDSRNDSGGVRTPTGGNQPSNATTGVTKAAPRAGAIVRTKMGIELVYVPAGSFMMGSSEADVQRASEQARREYGKDADLKWYKAEKPPHQVTIREGFYMGRYEVTQGQWQAVMGSKLPKSKDCDQCPVDDVVWDDAQEFIRKLNAQNDGYSYRLPSEAEWEYACRAGTTGDYAGDLNAMAWYYNNAGNALLSGEWNPAKHQANNSQTHPVGQKQPNGFGLYDMLGNVWELCDDVWHKDYKGAPSDGSAWVSGGNANERVMRGGSWLNTAVYLRSARRASIGPRIKYKSRYISFTIGVRLVAVARP